MKKININTLFIIVSSIVGITFSILFPLYQVPDELTHINMIYEERNLDYDFLNINDNYDGSENIIQNNENKVNTSDYFNLSKKIDVSFKFELPKITIVRHLPQCIGMLIGELFELPVFFYITLCELLALLFYIFVCNKALTLMPVKKDLFMFTMLLPVCCQQMCSFSYDVVLNSLSFLFIAYIFNLKYKKCKIETKDLLISIIVLSFIGICKIPYIALSLLYLLFIDYNKLISKIRQAKKTWAILIIIFLIFVIMFILKLFLHINFVKVFVASLINPIDTLSLLVRTLKAFIFGYFESIIGNLGWFDVKVSRIFVLFAYFVFSCLMFLKFNSEEKDYQCKTETKDNLIVIITILFLCYTIILSMFIWTLYINDIPNSSNLSVNEYSYYLKITPYIVGVQGRYFIPVIPLLLFFIKKRKNINRIKTNYVLILYYLIFYIYYVIILINRYWI